MVPTTKQTKEQVIAAIVDSGGIKAEIARRLGVTRLSVDHYLKRWPTVQQAYDDEVARVGDRVEANIIKAIYDDSPIAADRQLETSKWYARVKLKDRGYADRTELELRGNSRHPITFIEVGDAPPRRDSATLDAEEPQDGVGA